jgi:hypothetical protein
MSSLANLRDQAAGDPPSAPSGRRTVAERAVPAANWFCLDTKHSPVLLTEGRLFYFDGDGCPVCPVCQKQVVAQVPSYNAKGQPMIPAALLGLSSRIGEANPY